MRGWRKKERAEALKLPLPSPPLLTLESAIRRLLANGRGEAGNVATTDCDWQIEDVRLGNRQEDRWQPVEDGLTKRTADTLSVGGILAADHIRDSR